MVIKPQCVRHSKRHGTFMIALIVSVIVLVSLICISSRAEENPYQTITMTESEMEELRWVVALEATTFEDRKCVVASIFNRCISEKNDWGGTVHGVLSKRGQFSTYKLIGSRKAWATPDEIVDDAISEVIRGGIDVTQLPRYSYVYFDSKGGVNGKNHIKVKRGNTYGEE